MTRVPSVVALMWPRACGRAVVCPRHPPHLSLQVLTPALWLPGLKPPRSPPGKQSSPRIQRGSDQESPRGRLEAPLLKPRGSCRGRPVCSCEPRPCRGHAVLAGGWASPQLRTEMHGAAFISAELWLSSSGAGQAVGVLQAGWGARGWARGCLHPGACLLPVSWRKQAERRFIFPDFTRHQQRGG